MRWTLHAPGEQLKMNRLVNEKKRLLRNDFEGCCSVLASGRYFSRLKTFIILRSRLSGRGRLKKRTRCRTSRVYRNQRQCQPRTLIARAMVPTLKTTLERSRGKSLTKACSCWNFSAAKSCTFSFTLLESSSGSSSVFSLKVIS